MVISASSCQDTVSDRTRLSHTHSFDRLVFFFFFCRLSCAWLPFLQEFGGGAKVQLNYKGAGLQSSSGATSSQAYRLPTQ